MYHKLFKLLSVSSQTSACFTLKAMSLTANPYDSTMALPYGCNATYDLVRAEMKKSTQTKRAIGISWHHNIGNGWVEVRQALGH